MTNLKPAIEFFGNQAKLAKAMKLHPMAITQWKRRGMPPARAKEISDLTNGAIKPSDLLPNFFTNNQ
jgi:DNA-binding transcriptional regulator YdaS (Cro superfamily)